MMADTEEIQDDQSDEQATPAEGDEESASKDEPAEEDAAQGDDEGGDEEDAEEGDEEGESKEGEESPFEKLLAKYGGDKEKMARAVWESYNNGSAMAKKLDAIEKYILGQAQPKIDEEEYVKQDPNVQRLLKRYQKVEGRISNLEAQRKTAVGDYGKVNHDCSYLKGQLDKADPDSRSEIQHKLDTAEGRRDRLEERIKGLQDQIDSAVEERDQIGSEGQEAEKAAKDRAKSDRQQQEEKLQAAQRLRGEFADAMQAEAKKYGIEPGTKRFQVLSETINDRIVAYLSRLPQGAPGVQMPSAVRVLMAEYAEVMGLKVSKFQKDSTRKRQASGKPVKPTAADQPVIAGKVRVDPPKDGKWTRAYVEERAKRLLG